MNEELMELEGGKKKPTSSKLMFYESPLGYSIEDVRPRGDIKKFKSAAYSNVSTLLYCPILAILIREQGLISITFLVFYLCCWQCARKPS